jgi:hypothetical protein
METNGLREDIEDLLPLLSALQCDDGPLNGQRLLKLVLAYNLTRRLSDKLNTINVELVNELIHRNQYK